MGTAKKAAAYVSRETYAAIACLCAGGGVFSNERLL